VSSTFQDLTGRDDDAAVADTALAIAWLQRDHDGYHPESAHNLPPTRTPMEIP
jgi:hypothetical protein